MRLDWTWGRDRIEVVQLAGFMIAAWTKNSAAAVARSHANLLYAAVWNASQCLVSWAAASQDYGWGKELANYGEYSGAPSTEAAGRSCLNAAILHLRRANRCVKVIFDLCGSCV